MPHRLSALLRQDGYWTTRDNCHCFAAPSNGSHWPPPRGHSNGLTEKNGKCLTAPTKSGRHDRIHDHHRRPRNRTASRRAGADLLRRGIGASGRPSSAYRRGFQGCLVPRGRAGETTTNGPETAATRTAAAPATKAPARLRRFIGEPFTSLRASQTGVTRAADTCAPRYAAGTQQAFRAICDLRIICDFVTLAVTWTPAELSASGQRVALVQKFVHQSGGLSMPHTG